MQKGETPVASWPSPGDSVHELRRPLSRCLLEAGQAFGKSSQRNWDANSCFFRLENDKDCGFACCELLDQLVFHNNLRVAGEGVASEEGCVANIFAVDLKTQARGYKDTEWGEHTKDAGAVGEFLEIDGQSNIVAILSRHALDEGAYFVF